MPQPATDPIQPADAERPYVLGTDDAEAHRLMLQHRLWADTAHAHWTRAGFGPGDVILDIGSGPGYAARDLAQLLGPEGLVLAADESKRYIDALNARPQHAGEAPIRAAVADAQNLTDPATLAALGVEPGSCDGAYARWLLHFIPDEAAVLRSAADMLRPGGALAIQDYYDWRAFSWAPHGEGLELMKERILQAYAGANADASIGQKLLPLLTDAGFDVLEVRPLVRMARPHEPLWRWPDSYFRSFLPRLVESGVMTDAELATIMTEWDNVSANPDALFMSPPQVEIIAIRG